MLELRTGLCIQDHVSLTSAYVRGWVESTPLWSLERHGNCVVVGLKWQAPAWATCTRLRCRGAGRLQRPSIIWVSASVAFTLSPSALSASLGKTPASIIPTSSPFPCLFPAAAALTTSGFSALSLSKLASASQTQGVSAANNRSICRNI